jgi:hypothetical protein
MLPYFPFSPGACSIKKPLLILHYQLHTHLQLLQVRNFSPKSHRHLHEADLHHPEEKFERANSFGEPRSLMCGTHLKSQLLSKKIPIHHENVINLARSHRLSPGALAPSHL